MAESGGGWLDWDTAVSPRLVRGGSPGCRRGTHGRSSAVFPAGRRPSCWCALPGITPAAPGAWVSASSTTSRSRPPMLWRSWDWSGCSSSTGTCTTATAPRPRSTTIPRVLFFSIAPGRSLSRDRAGAGKWAAVRAPGFTVNVPLQRGRRDGAVRLAFESLLVAAGPGLPAAAGPGLGRVRPAEGRPSGRPSVLARTAFQWMAARLLALCQEVGAAGPAVLPRGRLRAGDGGGVDSRHPQGAGRRDPAVRTRASPTDERADVRETLEEVKPYWKGVF